MGSAALLALVAAPARVELEGYLVRAVWLELEVPPGCRDRPARLELVARRVHLVASAPSARWDRPAVLALVALVAAPARA